MILLVKRGHRVPFALAGLNTRAEYHCANFMEAMLYAAIRVLLSSVATMEYATAWLLGARKIWFKLL